jgi:hypothetical protein
MQSAQRYCVRAAHRELDKGTAQTVQRNRLSFQ